MSAPRTLVILLLLAVLVAVLGQGLVLLVQASGAREAPAVVLVLLLAAFLGLLTAVVTRSLNLPGAMAPTALVLGWIVVPAIFGAIPAAATQLFASDAALTATDGVALTVAVLAAALTLNVSGSG